MRQALAIRLAVVTIIALPVSAPLAQQAQGGGLPFRDFDLFAEGSVDLNPETASALIEAARRAQAPDGCPLGALFIHTPAGDPLFQEARAAARRQVVLELLNNAGIDTARFFVESIVGGPVDAAFLHSGLDRDAPTLKTTSVPPKGTKVEAGDEIKVTMAARDVAEPSHWQTGIKTIQLVADSEGGHFVASENYQACAEAPERRVEATYIVPENPPLVVRLSALAEDHTGLTDTDAAEFPTQGDWYGRIELFFHAKEDQSRRPNENRAETKFDLQADIVVSYDGQGNLTGELVGTQELHTYWWGYPHGSGEVCIGSAPPTPVRARIVGSYTPGRHALSLELTDVEARIAIPWSGGGPTMICSDPPPIDNAGSLSAMVRALQPAGDGSYQAELSGTDPLYEHRFSIILRPVAE
jgi:hypothetical protein